MAAPVLPTVQESRLGPVADALLTGSPLAAVAADGVTALTAAGDLEQLCAAARDTGRRLWQTAVAAAQTGPAALEDRPLYWARLRVTAALRTLEHPALTGPLAAQRRSGLLHLLDHASRGLPAPGEPLWPDAPPGAVRLALTGFDPFGLDADLRQSNPSGAVALALAGRVLDPLCGRDAGAPPVAVRAAMLPVTYAGFDQGVVEDAFGPVLSPGPDHADVVVTVSQTARGRMDVEAWAGCARAGRPDNDRAEHFGAVARPAHWPSPFDSPEWIATTLPWQAMTDAGTGPWPVALREGVLEWPAGTFPDPTAVREARAPSPGSTAAAGTGGDYLSNESMYRTNRLRQALGAWELPGGHLHISAVEHPADPADVTDAAFEADRRAVVEQTVALLRVAATAARRTRA